MAHPADLPQRLSQRLQRPLPARSARRRFAPPLCFGRHFGLPPVTARHAAVMILLCHDANSPGQWFVPLTLRPQHMTEHAGQISLPGGAIEADETVEQAALRELNEELGVEPAAVKVLGRLSTSNLFVSNFKVTPIVGCVENRPRMTPNPAEVAELIELPIAGLLNPDNYGTHSRPLVIKPGCPQLEQIRFTVPHIQTGPSLIWGATAIILGEFIEVLGDCWGS